MSNTILHNTAGTVLYKIENGQYYIFMIYRIWSYAPEGTYILPKGHVEDGETNSIAALRETTEETGYTDIEIGEDLGKVVIDYSDDDGNSHQKSVQWYLAKLLTDARQDIGLTDTELASKEFKGKWVLLKDANTKCKFDTDIKPIVLAQKILLGK